MFRTLVSLASLMLCIQAQAADLSTGLPPPPPSGPIVISTTVEHDTPPADAQQSSTANKVQPEQALATSEQAQTTSSQAQTTPSQAQTASSQAQTTPSQAQTASSQAKATDTTPAIPADSDVSADDVTDDTPSDTHIVSIQDESQEDLWQRIRTGLQLPEVDNSTVRGFERFYSRHPSHWSEMLDRARLYLFHVVEEVNKRNMPMEIALLPFVESAYNPNALSSSAASGLWQFVPSTGRVFGLKENGWYDGRRDVLTATRAALDYLERLHDMFGNWQLALAAYNCGEGCVQHAIDRNRARGRPTDLASLKLPKQTRNYVPQLLAIRDIVRSPEKFGLELDTIPNQPAFKKVTLQYPIAAKTAARLAGMHLDEFLALNPGFRHRVIYAKSQNTLLLPPDKADTFRKNLAETEKHDIRLHTYYAPRGTRLSRIANHFNVSLYWLHEHNPLHVRHGKLVRAQTLMLPPSARKIAAPAKLIATAKPEAREIRKTRVRRHPALADKTLLAKRDSVRVHTVRRGETLYGLAKRYNVHVADLVELNGHHKTLHPGDRIQIPASS